MCIYMETVTVFVDGDKEVECIEHSMKVGMVQWEGLGL